jgi:glycosyltransferase involved in cell wall biosynthesis
VEALAAGVPVAVGPAEATRELTRGAASLSPDASPTGLARAIEAALESGGPDSADGEERRWHAARFDFRTVALEMLEVYRTTLGSG